MTLFVLAVSTGCGEASEKSVERSAYADEVSIKGFRLSDRYLRSGDTVLTFVGPSGTDMADAVRAPGFDFRRSSPDLPAVGPLFEFLAEAYGIKYRDSTCRVAVERLKSGVPPLESMHLTAEEAASVREGETAVVQVTVGCSQPES